jgi:glycerate kinase
MQLLAAPDKFRGTLTARQAAAAIAAGAARAGWTAVELPLADGGEGTLDVLGGGNRRTVVTGPLGEQVDAEWRLEEDGTAIVESALAAGAHRIVVAAGGVASTDGGVAAVEALRPLLPLPLPLEVACDVEARFLAAAEVFAPQKGATAEQVRVLRERLAALDVPDLPGSGAAGGLAGGLAAVGARLLPGFDFVANRLGLEKQLAEADLVITGEGLLDRTSFTGKVVGRVIAGSAAVGVEVIVVAGEVAAEYPVVAISLLDRCGPDCALTNAADCVAEVVASILASRPNPA